MWAAVCSWFASAWAGLGSAANTAAGRSSDFDRLAAQYQSWAEAQTKQYLALTGAQQLRLDSVEALADRYRRWAERHIDAMEADLAGVQAERDAALARIDVLESKVAELEDTVRSLQGQLDKGK